MSSNNSDSKKFAAMPLSSGSRSVRVREVTYSYNDECSNDGSIDFLSNISFISPDKEEIFLLNRKSNEDEGERAQTKFPAIEYFDTEEDSEIVKARGQKSDMIGDKDCGEKKVISSVKRKLFNPYKSSDLIIIKDNPPIGKVDKRLASTIHLIPYSEVKYEAGDERYHCFYNEDHVASQSFDEKLKSCFEYELISDLKAPFVKQNSILTVGQFAGFRFNDILYFQYRYVMVIWRSAEVDPLLRPFAIWTRTLVARRIIEFMKSSHVFKFGKHKGKTYKSVFEEDKDYALNLINDAIENESALQPEVVVWHDLFFGKSYMKKTEWNWI